MTDEDTIIAHAYRRLGSVQKVVERTGFSEYAVRETVTRLGVSRARGEHMRGTNKHRNFEIKAAAAAGVSQKQIARTYGLDPSQVSRIISNA